MSGQKTFLDRGESSDNNDNNKNLDNNVLQQSNVNKIILETS